MADKKLVCEVVTPDRVVFNGEVDMVVAPGVEGEVGILPLHVPILTGLSIGELRIKMERDGRDITEYVVVHGGFMEVFEDRVTVLAPAAEVATEIDVERAQKAEAEAAEQLKQVDKMDVAKVEAAMRRAQVRIRAAGRTS